MSDRERADKLMVARGLVPTRARAQAEIGAGHVLTAGRVVQAASERLGLDAPLNLTEGANPYVSRGGLKLAHALDVFAIQVEGRVALDVGASTGGFTDVLLRRGAARVYAVDVGQGQLHAQLRTDERVIVLERTDARALRRCLIAEPIDIITMDVSFISVLKVLPHVLQFSKPGAHAVILVKPQFEVGRDRVGKGGTVRDEIARREAVVRVRAFLEEHRWTVLGESESPIRGGDGNVEYLIAAAAA